MRFSFLKTYLGFYKDSGQSGKMAETGTSQKATAPMSRTVMVQIPIMLFKLQKRQWVKNKLRFAAKLQVGRQHSKVSLQIWSLDSQVRGRIVYWRERAGLKMFSFDLSAVVTNPSPPVLEGTATLGQLGQEECRLIFMNQTRCLLSEDKASHM